ncbi:MAG: hypothetical protein ACLQU2_00970 [Candidatus Binataceae bacterium]
MSQSEQPAQIAAVTTDRLEKPSADMQFAHDLTRFTLADMVRCGASLRLLAAESTSMEEAARKVTRYLYDNFRDKASNQRSCVLVRLFKTHAYGKLTEDLREFAASRASSASPTEDTKCLILMATAGDDPLWNSRHTSKAHKSIALLSEDLLEQFPMIVHLIQDLRLSTAEVVRAQPELIKDLERKKFGIFYVPSATNSEIIPAQKEFVAPYGIASVLGFGGMLPGGDIFAAIVFSRVPIRPATAEMFRTIALNLKLGLLALLDRPVFAD